ncbi:ATP-binding protein [Tistrella mobilis]|uniref:sensor histidine kinase n=1 Tax=Tistrella mobilis TaxID=171437 RepID=UPI00355776EB
MSRWSPSLVILCAFFVGLVLAGAATFLAVDQPWTGLRLVDDGDAAPAREPGVRIAAVARNGPAAAAGVAQGMRLVAIEAGGRREEVLPGDLIEESDMLPGFPAIIAFQDRQTRLAAILAADWVELHLVDPEGEPIRLWIAPADSRPILDLPLLFWVQIMTGVGAMLIGGWVLGLRRDGSGPLMFFLSAPTLAVSAFSAAVYGTRELAIDGMLFRELSALNHLGAIGFGAAMISLFLVYPKRLVSNLVPVAVGIAVAVLWVLDTLRLTPGPGYGGYYATLIEMILIVTLIGVQWRKNRHDPTARAALRWLGLSIVLGAGAFTMAMMVPLTLGTEPLLSQGMAFGFFLLIYIGLALGVRRYRLFELDEWAFKVMFYTLGAMLLLAMDGVLIWLIGLDQAPSLGLSLIVVGFGYLPLREILWRRMVLRRPIADHELFRQVIEVAFTARPAERAERWRQLIRTVFDPLSLEPARGEVSVARADADGVMLLLPPTADAPALEVRYPWRGRGLFGPAHLQLAREMTQLMRHADEGRAAYERGATEERRRIARDLHDDVGARLLTGLHKADLGETRSLIRSALADIRTIAAGLARGSMPLGRVIADLRHETSGRLEAAGLALDWPLDDGAHDELPLDYAVYRNLFGALREIISNVIRHAAATTVRIEIRVEDGSLYLSVADDGIGLVAAAAADADGRADADGERPSGGLGLGNLARRVGDLGGRIAFPEQPSGTRVDLELPLEGTARPGPAPVG